MDMGEESRYDCNEATGEALVVTARFCVSTISAGTLAVCTAVLQDAITGGAWVTDGTGHLSVLFHTTACESTIISK